VLCDGDLRRALNALEVLVLGLSERATLTATDLEVFARERRIRYDADEDEHYDTISAYIKSCRGSDPDAAMIRLAKMLAGGAPLHRAPPRDLASEDVGIADPQALPLTVAAHHACDFIGSPEAELTPRACDALHLGQPAGDKSNSAALALAAAHAGAQNISGGNPCRYRSATRAAPPASKTPTAKATSLRRLPGKYLRPELPRATAHALHAEDRRLVGQDRRPLGALAGAEGATRHLAPSIPALHRAVLAR